MILNPKTTGNRQFLLFCQIYDISSDLTNFFLFILAICAILKHIIIHRNLNTLGEIILWKRRSLEKYEGALLCQEGLLEVFRYLQANRAVCLCALHSVGRENMKRLFQEKIYAVIHRTVEQLAKESGCTAPGITGDDIDLMTTVYILTLTGIAESWLLREIRETPEELVTFINQMLQDHVRGARMRESEDSHFPESKDTLPESCATSCSGFLHSSQTLQHGFIAPDGCARHCR